MNRSVRYALTKSCSGSWDCWEELIPSISFALRSRINSRTGYSPYFLLYGFSPRFPNDDSAPTGTSLLSRVVELQALPGVRTTVLRDRKQSSRFILFPVFSQVLVQANTLRKKTIHPKLVPRYSGPYRILESLPHNQYRIVSSSGKVSVIHASRLVHYVQRDREAL